MKLLRILILSIVGLWPVMAQTATVTLAWDRGTTGTATESYIIERKEGIGIYAEVGRSTVLTYTDTVAAATVTCWQVRATNGFATSTPSNSVCLDVPKAPVNFTVTTQGPSAALPALTVRAVVRRKK